MKYFSERYNIELTIQDVEDLYYEYLLFCKKNDQIPEYNPFEFSSLNKEKIDINFINSLIYYSKLKA